jgi:5-methylcytosine-specific restriction endonuclease McrA
MAEIVHYRRKWQGAPKKRVKSSSFLTETQKAAGVVDYYVSPQHRRHRREFFGEVWKGNKYIKTKNLLCVLCEDDGVVVAATIMDHITPRNKGGADAQENYQPLCSKCHDAKSAREKK